MLINYVIKPIKRIALGFIITLDISQYCKKKSFLAFPEKFMYC